MLAMLAIAPALAAPSLFCENCRLKEQGFHIGEMTVLGNGSIYTWAHVDKDGKPIKIGVSATETALVGLREDVPELYPKVPGWEYRLNLPQEAKQKSAFDHVSFDWNPKGHIPPGIYDVPHFDVHFYLISYQDRLKITAAGEDLDRCRKQPDAKYIPGGYIYAPESEEPKMGAHWVDTQTPELNGSPFTHTFIFGSYDGKVVFYEPMITLSFLKNKSNGVYAIKQPAAVQATGYYPTKYAIKFDDVRKEYTITLEEFVWMEAR